MQRPTLSKLALVLLLAASGCAVQQIAPAPLMPEASQSEFMRRSLDDARTRDFLAQRNIDVGIWPPARWTPEQLALAALAHHPAMAQARASARLADAQLSSAGLASPASVSSQAEHHEQRDPGQSAWSVELALDIAVTGTPLREARIARARMLAGTALLDEADAAWRIRSAVWHALLELWASRGESVLVDQLATVHEEALSVMQTRVRLGAADTIELARSRASAMQIATRRVLSQQRLLQAQAGLAQALALPASALDALRIDFSAFERVGELPAPESLRAEATLSRIDMRRALANHAAAEAALGIELLAQHPEIRLRPGLMWDQGSFVWQLGASLPLFAAQRQAGPIAEAVARRDIAAQDFLALQTQVLGELELARTRAGHATRDIDSHTAALADARALAQRTEQRLARGDADRLDRLLAQGERIEAELRLLQARQRALAARLALEDAVQRPLAPPARPQPENPQ
ncbi:MAG: TolC family protein [Gammaproteobacteria bacterium]|nr:TolC family protein [Gammaproteobacteria bacterium]MBU0771487.1 TolC family protein [Gammaproteobacteria bacterium]MBU0857433.1 TolC family protein [Gammaproteobacteria bacterium]MBU1846580.1 TolC family protein [Gammaproteobacteria bacterium]